MAHHAVAEYRWGERVHLYRCLRVKIVSVEIELVVETPERKQPEVCRDHDDVHHGSQAPDRGRPKGKHADQSHNKGNPLEFREILRPEFGHADVVVQNVDLGKVVPAVSPHQVAGIDVEVKPLRVLLGKKGHMPQGQHQGRYQHQSGQEYQHTASSVEGRGERGRDIGR